MTSFPSQPRVRKLTEDELYPERAQQVAAQICVVAVEKTREYIHRALRNVGVSKKKPKSRKDYNAERKRDFRAQRTPLPRSQPRYARGDNKVYVDTTVTETIVSPRVSALLTRVVELRQGLSDSLVQLNLQDRLIGDDGIKELSGTIKGMNLRSLCLTNNRISDKGLRVLIDCLRDCFCLEELYLNNNCIEDAIEHLHHHFVCFSLLRLLNLCRNKLTRKSFLYLGKILSAETKPANSNLSTLLLGGNPNLNTGSRILLSFLFYHDSSPMRKLDFAESSLGDTSLQAIAVYVLLSRQLESLNISRNPFTAISTKTLFSDAVRFNNSLKDLSVYLCDLPKEIHAWVGQSPVNSNEWIEDTELLFRVNGIVSRCRRDAVNESLNGSYGASESLNMIVLSHSDVVSTWYRLQALRSNSDDPNTVPEITDTNLFTEVLLDEAEYCLGLYPDTSDMKLRQEVAQAKTMIEDSLVSEEDLEQIKTTLVREIGESHSQHSSFATDGHLLFRYYDSYPSVAYVHFTAEVYVPYLNGLIKRTLEADAIAAAAQAKMEKRRRKDLVRARRRQLALTNR